MSIRDWPAAERPREKLLEQGAASLTDAELLAIFLRTGVTGKSAVDLARYLLSEFGSLRALLEADLAGFSQHLAWARPSTRNCRRCWRCRGAIWPSACVAIQR